MITGLDISKVEATREAKDVITNMKFNINFDDVKINQDSVEVAFTFITSYEGGSGNSTKNVGEIKIKGTIFSKEEKKSIDEINKFWGNQKTLPVSFAENIINLLNFECSARGTLLAYSMGFIAPLPLSRAKVQEAGTKN
ncbi:MAG: hypothetical protein ACP5RT_00505 [Candidatus Micrarchaeia archaeon]